MYLGGIANALHVADRGISQIIAPIIQRRRHSIATQEIFDANFSVMAMVAEKREEYQKEAANKTEEGDYRFQQHPDEFVEWARDTWENDISKRFSSRSGRDSYAPMYMDYVTRVSEDLREQESLQLKRVQLMNLNTQMELLINPESVLEATDDVDGMTVNDPNLTEEQRALIDQRGKANYTVTMGEAERKSMVRMLISNAIADGAFDDPNEADEILDAAILEIDIQGIKKAANELGFYEGNQLVTEMTEIPEEAREAILRERRSIETARINAENYEAHEALLGAVEELSQWRIDYETGKRPDFPPPQYIMDHKGFQHHSNWEVRDGWMDYSLQVERHTLEAELMQAAAAAEAEEAAAEEEEPPSAVLRTQSDPDVLAEVNRLYSNTAIGDDVVMEYLARNGAKLSVEDYTHWTDSARTRTRHSGVMDFYNDVELYWDELIASVRGLNSETRRQQLTANKDRAMATLRRISIESPDLVIQGVVSDEGRSKFLSSLTSSLIEQYELNLSGAMIGAEGDSDDFTGVEQLQSIIEDGMNATQVALYRPQLENLKNIYREQLHYDIGLPSVQEGIDPQTGQIQFAVADGRRFFYRYDPSTKDLMLIQRNSDGTETVVKKSEAPPANGGIFQRAGQAVSNFFRSAEENMRGAYNR